MKWLAPVEKYWLLEQWYLSVLVGKYFFKPPKGSSTMRTISHPWKTTAPCPPRLRHTPVTTNLLPGTVESPDSFPTEGPA